MRHRTARAGWLAMVLGASALAACATSTREEELGALRNDLTQVRTAPAGTAEINELKPPGVLVGMSAQQIEAALGPPDCAAKTGKHCTESAAMEYDFYVPTADAQGGGPTLLIFTDGASRCSEARWIFTE